MALMAPLRRAGLIAAALFASTLTLAGAAQAQAPGFGLFGNLFGGPGQRYGAPAYPGYGRDYGYGYGYGYGAQPRQGDGYYYQRPRHRAQVRKPVDQREASPKEKAAPLKNASMFVYVFGDTLGQMLGSGLDDAFAGRVDIGIVNKARGSTGLVASNNFDWLKSIDELLVGRDTADGKVEAANQLSGQTAEAGKTVDASKTADAAKTRKIDVAVMMIGANDHQSFVVDGKTVQPGTPEWKSAYTKRVLAIDEAFRAKKIPLIWVGVPIAKDDDFADAMAGLNDIYRETAAKTGATYVDTWEAFSDEDGDFSAYGPDINGQTVRLRAPDGVNFTKAGGRKLSHFVEAHVNRALEGKTPVPQLPTAEAPDAKGALKKATSVATVRPEVGPIRNLNEMPTATSGALASFDPKSVKILDPSAEAAHGAAVAVPVERADNARWSGTAVEP